MEHMTLKPYLCMAGCWLARDGGSKFLQNCGRAARRVVPAHGGSSFMSTSLMGSEKAFFSVNTGCTVSDPCL
jgi:hypothetical protein